MRTPTPTPLPTPRLAGGLALVATLAVLLPVGADRPGSAVAKDEPAAASPAYPSPIALALSADGSRLIVAEQGTGSVALVDPRAGKVLARAATGEKPSGVAIGRDGLLGVVSHWYGSDVAILKIGPESIHVDGRIEVGPEPRGVVLSPDASTAYVAVGASNEVVRVDLASKKVTGRLAVGREPRGIALTPDGARLLVGNARSRSLSAISTKDWAVERTLPIDGDNLRQVALSPDGSLGYVANMKNRGFPTTKNNIDIGWVLGQRLTRVPLDGSEPFATQTLDPEGKAVGDAHGVAVSGDGRFLAVSAGGTHEVLAFRTDSSPLPWRVGASRDLIAPELLKDDGRYRRVDLGGRPTEIAFDPDAKTLYVANYLDDSIQVVDVESMTLARSIPLGAPSEASLVRRGEALFHDASRSFNQWYSCNTCHSDGHTNGLDFDTLNDGWHDNSTAHTRSRKKVPTLRRVDRTGPWTWHGWQTSLEDAVVESFTKSMQGKRPTDDEVRALAAFLGTLDFPRNPHRGPDGAISEAARRGEAVYRSEKAACLSCHGGPELTDGKIHKVGLEEPRDVYKGYNPPSLRGVYDKDPYLHDGRARTLKEALTRWHSPEEVTGLGALTEPETDDLIEYLKTL